MTPRQQLALPTGLATTLGQKFMLIPALALMYGGAVAIARSAGLRGPDLERWTGVSSVVTQVGALNPSTWDQTVAAVVVAAGLVLFPLLLWLAWAQRLVPQRVRHAIDLATHGPGVTSVRPRAVERAAEVAASHDPGIRQARAALTDDGMTIHLHVRDAARLADLLREAEVRAQDALLDAGISDVPLRLAVTRFSAPSRTELLR